MRIYVALSAIMFFLFALLYGSFIREDLRDNTPGNEMVFTVLSALVCVAFLAWAVYLLTAV